MHPRKLTTENWNTRTPLEKDKYHERSTRPNHQFLIIVGFQNLVFRYIPYITVVKKTTHRLGTHHLLCFDLSCAKRLQWHNYILSSTTNLCAWWEGLIKRVEWCGMWLNISRMSRINGYTMINEKSPFDVRIMPFFSQNWWKWQFWNMTRYKGNFSWWYLPLGCCSVPSVSITKMQERMEGRGDPKNTSIRKYRYKLTTGSTLNVAIFSPNVGKSSIHGSYRLYMPSLC